MSISKHCYVLHGCEINNDSIDLFDDKFLPYIEGSHPSGITIIHSEIKGRFYIGFILARDSDEESFENLLEHSNYYELYDIITKELNMEYPQISTYLLTVFK